MNPAPTAAIPSHGALFYVAAVNLVIWAGLFGYMLYLDLKVRRAAQLLSSKEPR
ncbi:MAG TPA: CcmD family protein [Thermoanaerobaculia bacterium]|jgi:CcmD family protein|nr:CcmD family protein [Thermoanaerobaculia bacterium]